MLVKVKLHAQPEAGPIMSSPLGDALLSLRCVVVEAPSVEVGEHYAQLVLDALLSAGNEVR